MGVNYKVLVVITEMSEQEALIARISALLNSAIRLKNSKDYKKAVRMLEKCNPKPSLRQILDAQEEERKKYNDDIRIKMLIQKEEKARKEHRMAEDSKSNNNGKETTERNATANLEAMTLSQLEQELEELRRQEDVDNNVGNLKSEKEIEEEEEKRVQDVIKRYEKTFGRIKDLGSYRSSTASVTGKSIVSSSPSKQSNHTEFSTVSQREAFEKLKKLDAEEEKIKKEKDELLRFLESRSQSSKCTSRPATVSSIMSKIPEVPQAKVSFNPKPLHTIEEASIEKKPKKIQEKTIKQKEKNDPVSELIKNLY